METRRLSAQFVQRLLQDAPLRRHECTAQRKPEMHGRPDVPARLNGCRFQFRHQHRRRSHTCRSWDRLRRANPATLAAFERYRRDQVLPVSAVIPTIGRPELLKSCLASIAQCSQRGRNPRRGPERGRTGPFRRRGVLGERSAVAQIGYPQSQSGRQPWTARRTKRWSSPMTTARSTRPGLEERGSISRPTRRRSSLEECFRSGMRERCRR